MYEDNTSKGGIYFSVQTGAGNTKSESIASFKQMCWNVLYYFVMDKPNKSHMCLPH